MMISVLKENRERKLGISLYFGVEGERVSKILSSVDRKDHRNMTLE